MGQPAVTEYYGKWLEPMRARFWRVVLTQRWVTTIEPGDWVTVIQAALLIGVTDQVVAEWITREVIDPAVWIQEDVSGSILLPVSLVWEIAQHRRTHGQVRADWLAELSGTSPL